MAANREPELLLEPARRLLDHFLQRRRSFGALTLGGRRARHLQSHLSRELLDAEAVGPKFRLIGVGVSDLCSADEADRGDLVDTQAIRQKAAESAVDKLRARFGERVLMRGIALPDRAS